MKIFQRRSSGNISGEGDWVLIYCINPCPPKQTPWAQENHLIFSAGPASGSGLYYSSKVNVNTKSPLTGIYLYSISSGILAQQMRRAGFWAIDVSGTAESPTYLLIDNHRVQFKDAAPLWGLETAAAQKRMLKDASHKRRSNGRHRPCRRTIESVCFYLCGWCALSLFWQRRCRCGHGF